MTGASRALSVLREPAPDRRARYLGNDAAAYYFSGYAVEPGPGSWCLEFAGAILALARHCPVVTLRTRPAEVIPDGPGCPRPWPAPDGRW